MKIIKTTLCFCLIIAACACTGTAGNNNTACKKTENKTENFEQEGKVAEEEVTGVRFFDITLEQALEKAKKDGKYVFVNFHTKTCGPCKKMEKTIFPSIECGKYVNKNFVPIVIDGEDGGNGTDIAKQYGIFIYPTYLILNPDGSEAGEISGAEFNVEKFIGMLKEAIE